MKGQYLTLEYLIFFTIGIVMIVSVYYSFSNMNETYKETIMQSQLKMTGELISGMIINAYQASNQTNSTINYTFSIPTRLSSCIYAVSVSNNRLNVNCTNVPKAGVSLTLYNFNITNKSIIYSTSGLLKLYAKNGNVDLS
jgi:hypothetical protein